MGFRLTPQDTSFFSLFATSAGLLVEATRELTKLLEVAPSEWGKIAERLRALEHEADEATHAVLKKVNSSFITPFDREDIHDLAANLDDCMDHIEETADLIVLYRIESCPRRSPSSSRSCRGWRRSQPRRCPGCKGSRTSRVLDRDQPPREPGRQAVPQGSCEAVRELRRHPRHEDEGDRRRARGGRGLVREVANTVEGIAVKES